MYASTTNFRPSTLFQPMTSQTVCCSAIGVESQNFVVLAFNRTSVLRKELGWSRLYSEMAVLTSRIWFEFIWAWWKKKCFLKINNLYRLRWQTPELQFPDVEVSTQENQDFISESNQKTPKVIVTEKSFNSFTLSFDHFAPIEEYNHGYVALYKRANESQWQTEKGKKKFIWENIQTF